MLDDFQYRIDKHKHVHANTLFFYNLCKQLFLLQYWIEWWRYGQSCEMKYLCRYVAVRVSYLGINVFSYNQSIAKQYLSIFLTILWVIIIHGIYRKVTYTSKKIIRYVVPKCSLALVLTKCLF